jgi:hypothetical protein
MILVFILYLRVDRSDCDSKFFCQAQDLESLPVSLSGFIFTARTIPSLNYQIFSLVACLSLR